MTELQMRQALALARCKFPVASFDKRVARTWGEWVMRTPDRDMTPEGTLKLAELFHRYRRQIGAHAHDRYCSVCSPEWTLFPPLPVASDEIVRVIMQEPRERDAYFVLSDCLQAHGHPLGEQIMQYLVAGKPLWEISNLIWHIKMHTAMKARVRQKPGPQMALPGVAA